MTHLHRRFGSPSSKVITPVLVLLLLLVVGCGAAATATPAPIATKTPAPSTGAGATPTAMPQATPVPATTVNPGKLTWMTAGWGNARFTYNFSTSGGGNFYGKILHGYLIATNEKFELVPGIATKWEISPDGKTWTVTVRDGAKFHDGKAITAEDVWWSWMHYWGKDESGSALARSTQSTTQATARTVAKIEQPGPNQVSVTLTVPDGSVAVGLLSEAAPPWFGVLPKRPKVHDDAQEAAYDKNPIAAGPMKLVRYVTAEVMAYERFDDYYYQPKNGFPEDRRIKFKSFDLRLVPEEATRVAAKRTSPRPAWPPRSRWRPGVDGWYSAPRVPS